jgi:hypothetical protein
MQTQAILQEMGNEKIASLIQRQAELDELMANDCWRWCCQLVMTLDEAADGETSRIRRWPKHLDYLRIIFDVLNNEQFVIIPKSRRMLVTWLVCAWMVHSARYHKLSANFILSETEQKAAFCVDKRCHFIEQNLRLAEFRKPLDTLRTKTGLIGRMTYPNESYIWGISSTGDALRTYTVSKVLVDEIEFIDQQVAVVRSLLPLLESGAQGILVSSSNGPTGVLAEYCRTVEFGKWEHMALLNGEAIHYAS